MNDSSKFINRSVELKIIKEDIKNRRNFNKIFIITGDTGIGKSKLTERILSDFKFEKCIKVKVNARENSDLEQGLFIRLIGAELNKYAEQNCSNNKLINFLKSWSGSLKDYFTNTLLDDLNIINPLNNSKLIGKFIKYKFNKGEFNIDYILNDSSHKNLQIITSYIEHFLNTEFPFLINIENIHLIDYTSLELLSKIIRNTKQNYFLLEFTNNSSNNTDFIVNKIRNETIEIAITELPKLKKEDYRRIIVSNNNNIDRLIDFVYEQLNGNIRQLSDLKIILDRNIEYIDLNSLQKENLFDYTQINIRSLPLNDLFVLISIASNKNNLLIEQLYYIHKFNFDSHIDITKAISNLEDRNLINITNNGFIEINHDSILYRVLEENKTMYFLANKMWSNYYLEFYNSSNYEIYSRHSLLSNIFFHLMMSEPIRVLNILPDIKEHILSLFYPSSVKGYLNKIYNFFVESNIDSSIMRENILYFLIDINYHTNFFKEAYKLVNELKKKTLRSKLYKIVLLNRLDEHDKVISLVLKELEMVGIETPTSYILSLKLILMASYRTTLQFDKWIKLFESSIENINYKNLKEFGFLLRNSEMLLSHTESLPYLEESIKLFNNLNDRDEEAYARIAYSMQLGRLGRLTEAMNEAKYAQSLLTKRGMDQFLSLNNLAVIEILNQNFTCEVRDLLKQALVTAFDSFSRQNILTNILVWNTVNNERKICEELIEELLYLIAKQKDEMLNRITYFDIHYFYESIGDSSNSKKFKELARDCLNDDEQLWRLRFYNEKITDENYIFLSKFKYHVDFLTYWHFEINPDLENYETI